MNRDSFREFCKVRRLAVHDAGKDWHDASVRSDYLCAVIQDATDFSAIKPLLDDGSAIIASAKRYSGQNWFEYRGFDQISGDNLTVAAAIAKQYVEFLDGKDNISHYTVEDIAFRDRVTSEHPRLEGESETEHFRRLSDMQDDGYLVPSYVQEAGFYNVSDEELLMSDREREEGIWQYRYDNWICQAVAILEETN